MIGISAAHCQMAKLTIITAVSAKQQNNVASRSQTWYANWFSRIVEKLAKYLAGPDCEDAVGHMLEDVGDGVADLASG